MLGPFVFLVSQLNCPINSPIHLATANTHSKQRVSSAEDLDPDKLSEVPLTSVWYELPTDGVPFFPAWRDLALDIYWAGYERLREPLECKSRDAASHGKLQCTKGLGRLSVIYFGTLYTFLNKDELTDSHKDDFSRQVVDQNNPFVTIQNMGGKLILKCCSDHLLPSSEIFCQIICCVPQTF